MYKSYLMSYEMDIRDDGKSELGFPHPCAAVESRSLGKASSARWKSRTRKTRKRRAAATDVSSSWAQIQ